MTVSDIRALWNGQKYHLDRMSFGDLVLTYLLYPAVRAYLLILVVCGGVLIYLKPVMFPALVSAAVTVIVYPFAWYALHRWVLHGHLLYRFPQTAGLWKRIHFDHHQDPNDLRVLFGALYTTLPTIAAVALPIGYLVGGPSGSIAAFAAGIATTLFYEFFHCIQHLKYVPRNRALRQIKRLHMMHHFHNEQGNFGITNFLWDRLLGTYYDQASARPASKTVYNLGYDESEQSRYPWVARLSTDAENGFTRTPASHAR